MSTPTAPAAQPLLPPPLPAIIEPWIAYNDVYQVVLCNRGCSFAVTLGGIARHLRDVHSAPLDIRKAVQGFLQGLQSDYTAQSVPLPPARSSPQPLLPVLDGFSCSYKGCGYLSQGRKTIREHVNRSHQKKGLPDLEIFTPIRLQTWFKAKKRRYWIVEEGRHADDDSAHYSSRGSRDDYRHRRSGSGSSSSSEDGDTDILTWEKDVTDERQRLSRKPHSTETDPWLRYTEWDEILAQSKHDLVATHAFTATATAAEPHLQRVETAASHVLRHCIETLECFNHKDILKWWASPKRDSAHQVPFALLEKASFDKYKQTFIRLLLYVLRTMPAEDWNADTETGAMYTLAQWEAVQELMSVLGASTPAAVAASEDRTDDDLDPEPLLTRAVMRLTVSLVTEDTSQFKLYETAIMHYMAVRAIDTATRTLRPPRTYTPLLAHMLWIIRLVMLEIAVSEDGWPALGIPNRFDTGSIPGGVVARVHEIREKHLIEGSFSPASAILTQLAYGQAINRAQQNESNIFWSDDRQTVFYLGMGVAVAKIRVLCQELISSLRELLHELLFHQVVPAVPLADVVDTMSSQDTFREDGFSFISHITNRISCNFGWTFLQQRMYRDDVQFHLRQRKASRDGSGSGSRANEWIEPRVNAYLTKERQFLTQLLVAMHIMGGQPARGPEIGSIKVRNSVYSMRNIFIVNGRVAVVTSYDKSQKRRGNTIFVFRCYPDALSQIIAQYLVYVLPFARVVGQRKGDYLFTTQEEPWVDSQLSKALAVATAKHLGVKLGVSAWRQVAIAIGNEHFRKASRLWSQQDEETGLVVDGDDAVEGEQQIFEQIFVRQSAHGSLAAANHYAIDGAFLKSLGPDLINAYSQASRAWHLFLQLESKGVEAAVAVAVPPSKPVALTLSHRRGASQQLQPEKAKQAKTIQDIARQPEQLVLEGLCQVYGPGSRSQSEGQSSALLWIHQPAKPTDTKIIVLPTGSGKSALFFTVAAVATSQSVIVVVPYTALVLDLLERGSGSGLSCSEWSGLDSSPARPQLLLVSADHAVDERFLHYAKLLECRKQLAHIFFDECHVAFTDVSYRHRLRSLWKLRYLECPFTCLTATLPISLEVVLRDNLLIPYALILRRSTIRRTIKYTVHDSEGESSFKTGIRLVRSLPLPPGARGVIYVRSYTIGDLVSEAIQCRFYKAHTNEKADILREWASGSGSGSGGWIVATGALGTGIDIPGILIVVHIDRPYGLTSFMQQSGRSGRGGEVSESHVVVNIANQGKDGSGSARRRAGLLNGYSVEQIDENALSEYLQETQCRRLVLAAYFDGDTLGTDCVSTDSVLCDWCEFSRHYKEESEGGNGAGAGSGSGRNSPVTGTELIAQMHTTKAVENEQLMQFCQALQGNCIYCVLMLPPEERAERVHSHIHCRKALAAGFGAPRYASWRRGLKLASHGQCYRCGLSQAFCASIEEGGRCEYFDILLPGMWCLFQAGLLWGLCSQAGFEGGKEENERQWQWLNEEGEEQFGELEVNWQRVWRRAGKVYFTEG
jgi:superfamily II DNA helicase RecQ